MNCSEILTKERGPTGPSILAVVVAVVGFTPFPRVAWPAVAPRIPLLIYNALPSVLTGQFTAVICSKSTHTHTQSFNNPSFTGWQSRTLPQTQPRVSEVQNTTFQNGESINYPFCSHSDRKNPTHLRDHKPWKGFQEL